MQGEAEEEEGLGIMMAVFSTRKELGGTRMMQVEMASIKTGKVHIAYKESPRGAASGLSRCNFFRLQTSLLSLFLVQMG